MGNTGPRVHGRPARMMWMLNTATCYCSDGNSVVMALLHAAVKYMYCSLKCVRKVLADSLLLHNWSVDVYVLAQCQTQEVFKEQASSCSISHRLRVCPLPSKRLWPVWPLSLDSSTETHMSLLLFTVHPSLLCDATVRHWTVEMRRKASRYIRFLHPSCVNPHSYSATRFGDSSQSWS